MKRFGDFLIVVALVGALALSATVYRADRAGRAAAARFVHDFGIQVRRPDVATTVGYAPSADWTADIIADAAVSDAFEPVDLASMGPAERNAWMDSVSHVDDELRAAQSELLHSIAVRPGWPFHQSLLGQVVFSLESRKSAVEILRQPELWSVPLLSAADAAPADGGVWQSPAVGYLSIWPELRGTNAQNAPRVLREAFRDPQFVSDVFGKAAAVVGKDRAIALLPDSAAPLRAAFDTFARQNDVAGAAAIHRRWEIAEWNERTRDLAAIERHARRGDIDDVRSLTSVWLAQHPPREFDTPVAEAQTARVLALWPGGQRGGWMNDPVADACRYLLTRNDPKRYATTVARLTDGFDDVPVPLMAEVKAMAGQMEEGERMAETAQEMTSLQWAPLFLTLARSYLEAGHPQKAESACAHLPEAAGDTHEALLVRSAVAKARGDGGTSIALLRQAAADTISPLPACGTQPAIAVHGAPAPQIIRVRLRSSAPLLVDLDQNDARNATVIVDGDSIVAFPVRGWRDQTLSFRVISGRGELCAQVL